MSAPALPHDITALPEYPLLPPAAAWYFLIGTCLVLLVLYRWSSKRPPRLSKQSQFFSESLSELRTLARAKDLSPAEIDQISLLIRRVLSHRLKHNCMGNDIPAEAVTRELSDAWLINFKEFESLRYRNSENIGEKASILLRSLVAELSREELHA